MSRRFVLLLITITLLGWATFGHTFILMMTGGETDEEEAEYEIYETFETSEYDTDTCGTAPCVDETGGDPDGDTLNSELNEGIDMEDTYCVTLDHNESLWFNITDSDEIYILAKWAYSNAFENNEWILKIYTDGDDSYLYAKADLDWYIYCDTFVEHNGTDHAVNSDIWIKVNYKRDSYIRMTVWDGSSWDSWTSDSHSVDYQADKVMLNNDQDEAAEDHYWDNVMIAITDTDPFTDDPSTY